jgi:hypothetical protein
MCMWKLISDIEERIAAECVWEQRTEKNILTWDEVIGSRKLDNEELHNFYSLPDFIKITKTRRMRFVGGCSTHGRKNKCSKVLVWVLDGKRPPGKPRWDEMIECEGVECIHLAQNMGKWQALVSKIMKLQFP